MRFERTKKSEQRDSQMVPESISGNTDFAQVDTTWGEIQPNEIAEGVQTVGELEVIEHLKQGEPVIDARTQDFCEQGTLPGAVNIPHSEIEERIDELDREKKTVFFCNGPQCKQSPWAIKALLKVGYPPEKILYYRGGIHDWVTLGLPIEKPPRINPKKRNDIHRLPESK